MELLIRPARSADLAELASLLKILFSIETDFTFNERLQTQGLQQMLKRDGACILVAEKENSVIGMCSGQLTLSTAEGGPSLLVEDVVVRKEWRGQGIGQRLMMEIAAWAGKMGATRMQLLADKTNAQALDFYQALGWQSTQLICLRKKLE